VVSSTPRPHFTRGKDPVPIVLEAGWAPGPVWTGANSRPYRDSIPDRSARSSVAIPTELPDPKQNVYSKGKDKVHPRTGHESPEEEKRYSSTLSLTSMLDGDGWSTPRPGRFTPWERPGTHLAGGWVGLRAGLDGRKISPIVQSLYRLSYRANSYSILATQKFPTNLLQPEGRATPVLEHG